MQKTTSSQPSNQNLKTKLSRVSSSPSSLGINLTKYEDLKKFCHKKSLLIKYLGLIAFLYLFIIKAYHQKLESQDRRSKAYIYKKFTKTNQLIIFDY